MEDSFGVTKVTSVQKLALPVLLNGSDALVRSQTGSGKTLAYAIPIVEALHRVRPKMSRTDGIKAIVVLPTRELALQTYECFVKLIKVWNILTTVHFIKTWKFKWCLKWFWKKPVVNSGKKYFIGYKSIKHLFVIKPFRNYNGVRFFLSLTVAYWNVSLISTVLVKTTANKYQRIVVFVRRM